jgi:hypothetical protein
VKFHVLVIATILAGVLAAGCSGPSLDQRLKSALMPEPTDAKIARIRSDNPDERREALHGVAADPKAREIPKLVEIFCLVAKSDTDPMVRSAAVRGLADMQGENVIPALRLVATKDGSPYVRVDALAALGHQAKPEGVDPVASALQSDTNSDVRVAAAEALRNFKDKAAAQALAAALADPKLAVAVKAWESLRFMTGQNLPPQVSVWTEYLASGGDLFAAYGKPPPMPKPPSQRPTFKAGPLDGFRDLFKKDPNEAELE